MKGKYEDLRRFMSERGDVLLGELVHAFCLFNDAHYHDGVENLHDIKCCENDEELKAVVVALENILQELYIDWDNHMAAWLEKSGER